VHNLSTESSSFFLPHTGDVTCQLHFEISCRLREWLCTLPSIGDFQEKSAILNCGRNTYLYTSPAGAAVLGRWRVESHRIRRNFILFPAEILNRFPGPQVAKHDRCWLLAESENRRFHSATLRIAAIGIQLWSLKISLVESQLVDN
jgi:hypothetical protein